MENKSHGKTLGKISVHFHKVFTSKNLCRLKVIENLCVVLSIGVDVCNFTEYFVHKFSNSKKNRTVLRFFFVPCEYLGSACTVTLLMYSVLLLETLDFFMHVYIALIIDLIM